MLKPGTIPDQEPTIRVGLILPEDRQTHLHLSLPHPEEYILSGHPHYSLKSELSITTEKDLLIVDGRKLPEIHLQHRVASDDIHRLITLDPVIAGRGFHWEKHIAVTVAGDLIIRNHQGILVVINELPVEDYLMSVATSEMGADCPSALIEAQTIVARSWLLAAVEQKHRALGMDVCNDDCCQRYQGAAQITAHSRRGVAATRGQLLVVDGEICDARYSKSCGGMTERFEHIWPGPAQSCFKVFSDTPPENKVTMDLSSDRAFESWLTHPPHSYCSPAFIPETKLTHYLGHVDEQGSYFRWVVKYSQTDITNLLNTKLNLNATQVLKLSPENRGGSGRLNRLTIHYKTGDQIRTQTLMSEYEIRRVLHQGFLYSSAFLVETGSETPPDSFTLKGAGWGHGVGLCQIGALGMALAGLDARTIVEHYYPGAQLTTKYS